MSSESLWSVVLARSTVWQVRSDPRRPRKEHAAFTNWQSYSARMTYEQFVDFVRNRMRMSHVYQPVTLMNFTNPGRG
jgi:hypothetical protein